MGTSLKNPQFRLIYMVVLPCIPKVYLIKISPVKVFSSLILSCTLICFWSCSDSGEPKIEGCMDSTACNYSIENTYDDGSCWSPTEGCTCANAEDAIVDECGVCGGGGSTCSNISYATTIKPIFTTNQLCTSCHSVSFFSHVNLMSVVEVADSSNSMLIKRLKGEVTPQMPKNKTPLEAQIITSIATWIQEGALDN